MSIDRAHLSALALALSAGLAASALASGLELVPDRGQTRLSFQGQPFHVSAAPVASARTYTFPGSRTVLMTWDQVGAGRSGFAISLNGTTIAQVGETENLVRLRYQSFDPLAGEPAVPESLRAGAENELYLVQFVATPLEEMRQRVRELGGTIERFLTDNTHIVRMGPETRERARALGYVRWIGAYHPAYRLDERSRAMLLATPSALDADGATRYSIEVMRGDGVQQQLVANAIEAMGGIVEGTQSIGTKRMEASLTPSQLKRVLALNEVSFVDPWGPAGTDTTIARQIGGASTIVAGAGFTGQGVRGSVQDNEVQMNHPAWNGQMPLINGPVDPAPLGLHGTACYGINFSTGASGFSSTTGFLPAREQGIFSFYGTLALFGGSDPRLERARRLTDSTGQFRSVYESNSWGTAWTTLYTTESAEMDDIVFRSRLLTLNSQANRGTQDSRPQAWAKNVLSVGGIVHNGTAARTDDTRGGASIGPAADNRIKPDLSHFFDATTATWATSTTTTFSGTSNATPIVAGHAGLFHQMWHQGVWPGQGGSSSVFASRPSWTLAKAALIASAYRYTWGAGGANDPLTRVVQGWGMPDVGKLYQTREKVFVVNESDSVANAQTQRYSVTVLAGEPELLVTMVYADPPGTPGAAQARVNNLSLKVTSPTGQVYWGNFGLNQGNNSLAGGTENNVDTVENVFVTNPTPGPWTIDVVGTQVVQATVPGSSPPRATFSIFAIGVQGQAIAMILPNGAPSRVPQNTPTSFPVRIIGGSQTPVPGSAQLFYRRVPAEAFSASPLIPVSGTDYTATLPAFRCSDQPEYYLAVQGNAGALVSLPPAAPTTTYTLNVGLVEETPVVSANFSAGLPMGWTATGLWRTGAPCAPGGTPCNFATNWAYYGNTQCTYVAGGATTGDLAAPPITLPSSLPPGGRIELTYCYALQTEENEEYDLATVLINGVPVDRPLESDDWTSRTIDLTAMAGQTIDLRFRFDSVDGVSNDYRGWHVGNVRVTATTVSCSTACYPNCDGSTAEPVLNALDFNCFLLAYRAGDAYANCDGSTAQPVLNALDFNCFLNRYRDGCR